MAHAKSPARQLQAIKSGVVYYKPSKTSLQSTRKYWCELYRESNYHPRQLVLVELHKPTEKVSAAIALENVFKVAVNEGLIKGKFVFHVMTSKGKFSFGTDSSKETDSWVDALNEELFGPPKHDVIYEYRVQVKKIYEGDKLYGDYLLKVYNTEIRLFTPNGLIPTTFKCPMEEIHRVKTVKYHPIGSQNCCVIISVKNVQTNNQPKDILILNTNTASDVAKVINYRKKKLTSQDELLHAKSAIHDEARFAHEEKHKFQPRKWKTLEATRTASDPLLHEAKTYTKENTLTSDTNFNSMTSQPTHEEDGDVWSDFFDQRAPKHKSGAKVKDQVQGISRATISRRPPATLPHAAEINPDDSGEYTTIDSTAYYSVPWSYSWLLSDETSNAIYDYVPVSHYNFLRITGKATAGAGATELHSEDGDEEGYVINSIDHDRKQAQYLCVLSHDEMHPFTFMPEKTG